MRIDSLLRRLTRWSPTLAPSLYDLFPNSNVLPRSLPRFEIVPVEAIVGTMRSPSNTTAEFLPIRPLRTRHWRHDWRRVLDAQEQLVTLPPVDLLKVGPCYFVVDGHKRVAAARKTGAAVDANVVELRLPAPVGAWTEHSARRGAGAAAAACPAPA